MSASPILTIKNKRKPPKKQSPGNEAFSQQNFFTLTIIYNSNSMPENREIRKMNEIIAEFMGKRKVRPLNSSYESFAIWGKTYLDFQLDFHKDWNWLMAVVEKIQGMGHTISIGIRYASVELNEKDGSIGILMESTIAATHAICCDFIHWYKTHPPPP